MADVTGYKFKSGSTIQEYFIDVPAGATQISLTHSLGRIPDFVIITPKTQYHVFESTTRTASVVYLTGTTGTSTCDVIVGIFETPPTITETST